MNLSQRNRNIILWIVAAGLLISMVISFTPGTLFGNNQQDAEGPVALNVNGEPIRELEISRLEQNPPFNAIQEGPVAEDLQLVLLDQLVTQSLVQQAAAGESVSSGEVRTRVNEFREAQNVAGTRNDRAYQDLLAGAGYTDASFRELTRQQLQQEKYLDSLTADTEVSDAEIETFYTANQVAYVSEPRITAREIVVADKATADQLYARALAGEDFAALARENSSERAEQGGALGAAEGESTPQPVTQVALPTAVSQAAFALQGPGLTTPIEAGGAFHIVSVEAFTPAATQPLDEIRDEVRQDVLELKESGAQETALLALRDDATITAPEGSQYSYENPAVARIGDYEIKAADLNSTTYLNPQIQQLLTPDSAEVISSFLKPNNLDQMIDQELAHQGSERLDATFVGTRAAISQSALGYVSRDVTATPAQIQTYYRNNRAEFTEAASALTTRVNFGDRASAAAFRETLTGTQTLAANTVTDAAAEAGGTVQELGEVAPGSQPEVLGAALFNFETGMTPLGDSGFDVSQVLTVSTPAPGTASGGATSGGAASGGAASGGAQSGGAAAPAQEQFVVLVAARTPERVRPLSEARAQAEQAVLDTRRTEVQQTWLDGLREDIPVENLLAASTAEERSAAEQTAAATAAAAARAETGGASSGGAAAAGSGDGATVSGGAALPTPPAAAGNETD